MFDRGEIYDGQAASSSTGDDKLQEYQSRLDGIKDDDSLEKRMQDAELLRDLYMRNGKEDEAKELNEKIQMAKNAVKERERQAMDWDNPTDEMLEDAKKH